MIRIFIAYSSKDLAFKDEIRKRLNPLKRAGKVEIWDNWDIKGGTEWDVEVRDKLANADLILLLLSPDALDSEYFYEVEAPISLARHQAGEAIAVGVLLRPCSFRHTPFEFGKYELLPKKGYPVTDSRWHNADEAYLTIFQEVDVLVERLEGPRDTHKVTDEQLEIETAEPPASVRATHNYPDIMLKNGQIIRDIPQGPEMVFVEGGDIEMGSEDSQWSKPIHSISVHSFWIGKFPVTFEEYDCFCVDTGKAKRKDEGWGRGLQPINVIWEDAQEYCKWLSEKTGAQYRLPSEAEWEYAARGGNLSNGCWFAGSNDLEEVGWYEENSERAPHYVGGRKHNELGIHDMSGNVWEWCQDEWRQGYEDGPNDGSAWEIDGSRERVVRGGSVIRHPYYCTVAFRIGFWPDARHDYVGFRVARDV